MLAKDTRCILMMMANGFEEIEAMTLLSTLRQAGLCVKSVALTSGLVGGLHGVWLMPDLTLADLDRLLQTTRISLVILPGGGSSLAQLETDPRVHKLLRQAIAQGGRIVASPEGLPVLQAAGVGYNGTVELAAAPEGAVILRNPAQPLEVFARRVIRGLR